jgi:hypothetical protein
MHRKIRPLISSVEVLEARIAPATIYAVDTTGKLIAFDSATPGTLLTGYPVAITGLTNPGTEFIQGIDFRPATGQLYALGITDTDNNGGADDIGRIYTLNTVTGALTALNGGTPFKSDFADNNDYGFDINPAVDRIRIVTDRNDNLRVNPNTGALVLNDTAITPAAANLVGAAYDRNFDGTPLTTLFAIDNNSDELVRIGGVDGNPSPNGGVDTVIGSLGVTFSDFKVGFDIESRTGTAYAVIRPSAGGSVTNLYTINLASGAATLVGAVSGNPDLEGMSVALPDDLTIVNPTTATYFDQDGDKVTVKVAGAAAGASLSKSDFTFSTGQFGSQLKLLNFADDGQEWAKANISINAVPFKTGTVTRGDSFATVGYINATGVDLGKVTVNGDLGQIDAGDATTKTPGLASLTVASMGVFVNSQLPTQTGIPNQISDIVGKLGSLTIKGDMIREQINVTGGAVDGAVGNVTIAGDVVGIGFLASSGVKSSGPMGNVTIGGSIFGGSTTQVGSIISGTTMGNVTVGGSIYGGTASSTGIIESGTNMGNVLVKGSIIGGTTDHTGNVHSRAKMGNVTINGSIIGGTVADPVNDLDSGIVYSFGTGDESIGNVKVGGNLVGSNSDFGGSIFASNKLGNVTILGFIKGSTGSQGGNVESGNKMGTVKISGDATGGSGFASGSIYTFGDGNIAGVTIGGALEGTVNTTQTGILSGGTLGAVKLGEARSNVSNGVRISAEAKLDPKNAAEAKAIASITILGSLKNTLILGGFATNGSATNPDATIGAVTVGGNWISSSLIAGVTNFGANDVAGGTGANADNINFGDTHDFKILPDPLVMGQPDGLLSKIASVTIKGFAAGTVGGTDFFGIVAEQIGSVKVGARTYTLATGTDLVGFNLGTTNDFRMHEV